MFLIVPGNPLYIVMNNRSMAGKQRATWQVALPADPAPSKNSNYETRFVSSRACRIARDHACSVLCARRSHRGLEHKVSRNLTSLRICRCAHCFAERCVNRILNWRCDRRTVSSDKTPPAGDLKEKNNPLSKLLICHLFPIFSRGSVRVGFDDIWFEIKTRILQPKALVVLLFLSVFCSCVFIILKCDDRQSPHISLSLWQALGLYQWYLDIQKPSLYLSRISQSHLAVITENSQNIESRKQQSVMQIYNSFNLTPRSNLQTHLLDCISWKIKSTAWFVFR